jgi:hypothetical protein
MKKQTEIYSIFSQIDAIVAQAMVDEGKANKISADLIPPTALFNDAGDRAHFAIAIHTAFLPEYEERVRTLRA